MCLAVQDIPPILQPDPTVHKARVAQVGFKILEGTTVLHMGLPSCGRHGFVAAPACFASCGRTHNAVSWIHHTWFFDSKSPDILPLAAEALMVDKHELKNVLTKHLAADLSDQPCAGTES